MLVRVTFGGHVIFVVICRCAFTQAIVCSCVSAAHLRLLRSSFVTSLVLGTVC